MKCARVKVVFGKKEFGLFFFFFPPFEENAKSSDQHKNTRYARSLAEKERERERERDD